MVPALLVSQRIQKKRISMDPMELFQDICAAPLKIKEKKNTFKILRNKKKTSSNIQKKPLGIIKQDHHTNVSNKNITK